MPISVHLYLLVAVPWNFEAGADWLLCLKRRVEGLGFWESADEDKEEE